MSPLSTEDRLDAIAADVVKLRAALIESTRHAGELLDGEAEAERADEVAAATRMLLDAKLALYFDESEKARASKCPIHGDAIYASCADCLRIHRIDARRCA
jgi:hypothetical protein